MAKYTIGANWEREVKHRLEDAGWLVFRSAGSKGIADLVAFSPVPGEVPLWVQCKVGRRPSQKQIEENRQQAALYNCRYLVAWKRRKRESKLYQGGVDE